MTVDSLLLSTPRIMIVFSYPSISSLILFTLVFVFFVQQKVSFSSFVLFIDGG